MKTLISFLFLIFILVNNVISQSSYSLVSSGKLWNTYNIYAGIPTNYTKFYRFDTDTLINAINYFKLEESIDSITWINTSTYWRQEDSGKKVYLYYNGNEGLMYDFSLNKDDSVLIENVITPCGISEYIKIDSIDSILVGNGYRKILYTDNNDVWIEGIGDLLGLFHPNYYCTGELFQLVCYYENDTLKYLNPIYAGCQTSFLGLINSPKESRIKILTFVDCKYRIESEDIINDITLFDITGRKVAFYPVKNKSYEFSLSLMNGGIYILKCTTDNYIDKFFIVR